MKNALKILKENLEIIQYKTMSNSFFIQEMTYRIRSDKNIEHILKQLLLKEKIYGKLEAYEYYSKEVKLLLQQLYGLAEIVIDDNNNIETIVNCCLPYPDSTGKHLVELFGYMPMLELIDQYNIWKKSVDNLKRYDKYDSERNNDFLTKMDFDYIQKAIEEKKMCGRLCSIDRFLIKSDILKEYEKALNEGFMEFKQFFDEEYPKILKIIEEYGLETVGMEWIKSLKEKKDKKKNLMKKDFEKIFQNLFKK